MHEANLAEAAADWFNRHEADDMTADDARAFEAWLESDPAARAAYDDVTRSWQRIGALADDRLIMTMRDAELRRHVPAGRRAGHRRNLAAIAAAAVLGLCALPAITLGYLRSHQSGDAAGDQIIATGPDQRATRTLADGSIVTLDEGSELRVYEMGAERRLGLIAGHAFFRVAKDPKRPFLVTAEGKTVHALGTAFDVRIAGQGVAVTLVEGKVRVDQPGSLMREPLSADMTPGHRLVAVANRSWSQTTIDPASATSWLDDKLVYSPASLAKVIADVNAGSDRKIVLTGPVDPSRRIFGVFNRGDVDALVTVLEMNDVAHVVSRDHDQIEMAMMPPATRTKPVAAGPVDGDPQ